MNAVSKLPEGARRVRVPDLPWEPLGDHGLRRKVIGHDPVSGHVTFLLEIPSGWHGGGVAHFHECHEEVLMLEGSVTLDGRHYWRAGDYFYRPAHVVHGLDEKSEEGARALVRCDAPMQLRLVPEPERPTEYKLPECSDPRGHVFSVPSHIVPFSKDPALPDAWTVQVMSGNPRTGARTLIVEIPAGWTGRENPGPGASWEAYVLDGELSGEEGEIFAAGDYTVGDGSRVPFGALGSLRGARFLLWMFEPH